MEQVERDVRAACTAGDHAAAATLALRGYGPEIYGFLAALHRGDADDVFAIFSASLWRGLPAFEWSCTLRTWAYTIARNTSNRFRRGERRTRAEIPLDEASAVERLAHEIRTATRSYLRTEHRTKFAELRASLPAEDQELLILRVDRKLAWNELAIALADEPLAGRDLQREAARLRKRFQLLKERLLELGRREGLLPAHD
ncbi:MAG: RNA polymerase sigma factor [Acidobacteriota bacterium]